MIKPKCSIILAGSFVCWGTLYFTDPAYATQMHVAPEGIYAHQMAHLFFMFSMATLIYWLRARRLIEQTGWRYIQNAALFFIFWNIDTFMVHLLDEQLGFIQMETIAPWQIRIISHNSMKGLEVLYYIAKLDHLFCVPALLFLYAGLKRLLKESRKTVMNKGAI